MEIEDPDGRLKIVGKEGEGNEEELYLYMFV